MQLHTWIMNSANRIDLIKLLDRELVIMEASLLMIQLLLRELLNVKFIRANIKGIRANFLVSIGWSIKK